MSWEERMGAKARVKREAQQAAEWEAAKTERREAQPWLYNPIPPDDDDLCRDCYEWRLYSEIDGYRWFPMCGADDWDKRSEACRFGHDHHDHVVWFASTYAETPT